MRRYVSLLAVFVCLADIFVKGINDGLYDESIERYSSSTVGLLKLLNVEQQFADSLIRFAKQQGKKVPALGAYLSAVDYKLNSSPREKVEYVSNPLNALSLLRRTHEDLPKWHAYFKKAIGINFESLDKLVEKVPSLVDLMSAMKGIKRIANIYDLRIDDLAEGLLHDKQYNIRMTYRDLIAMGNLMFQQRDYQAAAKWYRIAYKRELEDRYELFNEILGNPSENLYRQYIKSLFVYESYKSIPLHSVEEALIAVENSMADISQEELYKLMSNLNSPENDVELERGLYQTKTPASKFEIGCRGLYRRKPKLVCRYKFNTTPFLRLAPMKFEEININPYIGMYHNVLYDSEIEVLKEQSTNMANGYADKRNDSEIRDTVARHAWWTDTSAIRERINRRIEDMTGFNFSKTEMLQVANYGVGSYFQPHFDYTSDGFETPDVSALGDRLASILFYASDVPQGGATVFPEIKVTVFPRKGSSLYWFNLFDDGRPDIRSQHSVCPVINGDRWTLTKWIHLLPQMFIMPCKS